MREKKWRQQDNRNTKLYVVVFCEWYTEICYLKAIINLFIKTMPYQILLIDKPKWKINTEKQKLIDIGNSRNKEVQRKLSDKLKSNITSVQVKKIIHSKYFLTDIDDSNKNNCFNKVQVNTIKKTLLNLWIKTLFSNIDIETFIYSHVLYSPSDACNYKKEIKKVHNKYDKGDSLDLQKIHEDIIWWQSGTWIIKLKGNMKKLKDYHNSNNNKDIFDMNPYSEVVELINELLPSL